MSIIDKLATSQGAKSNVRNQIIAIELAENKDTSGITTIAENLDKKDNAIQSDCFKVR